jgi:pilus assembly protein CpaD
VVKDSPLPATRSQGLRVACAALLGLTLGACTPPGAKTVAEPAFTPGRITSITGVAAVAFEANGSIGSAGRAALADAVGRMGPARLVHVSVPEAGLDPVRRRALAATFAGLGLLPGNVTVAPVPGVAAGPGSTMELRLTRYEVTPPGCKPWSDLRDGDRFNDPTAPLGCSLMNNLALMVDDPADLVAGRPLAPASGAHAAAGVERYATGQVKPFLTGEFWDSDGSALAGGGQ